MRTMELYFGIGFMFGSTFLLQRMLLVYCVLPAEGIRIWYIKNTYWMLSAASRLVSATSSTEDDEMAMEN